MKKSIIYIAALFAAAVGFTACDNDFEIPPYQEAGTTGETIAEANTTIAELKEAFTQDVDYFNTPIGTKDNGEHYIIRGRVTSNTRAGNVFKKVCVEDATGGVIFSVNSSYVYQTAPFGQEIIVDCTGMYYGNYGAGVQIGSQPQGASATSAPERMPEDMWKDHVTAIGIPDPSKVTVHEVTVPELKDLFNNPETRLEWQGLLVKINDCRFQSPGVQLGVENASNNSVYLTAAEGGNATIAINTSGYSTLWNIYAPSGTGSVTGVLSRYRNDWQLALNDADGIGDTFKAWEPGPEPIYSESFQTNIGKFTIENISLAEALTYVWSHDSYGYMKASAYVGQSYASDSWLISPLLDLSEVEEPGLTFDHCTNKFPSLDVAKQQVSLAVRTEGGEWNTVAIPEWSTNADWTFVNSGNIDLAAYSGKKIQIGFHYTSQNDASGTWEVKNFAITGKGTITVTEATAN
ncbi:MAG: hypothetical protein HDS68_04085 [Bacteroidales bacterium]|nr:hypothetical protein [Bacteroidales bacterium]